MRNEAASMMMATAAAFTLVACDADTITTMDDAAAFDTVEMVTICHLNVQTGSFQPLLLATGVAVEKHLAHGDLQPGDPLPNGNGTMPEDCSGLLLPVLAIAYTDVDANDGGYREGVDRPISVLLDANLDGVVSVGDEIRVYGFPIDFDASAFGSVAVSSHNVASVVFTRYYIIVADAAGSTFRWSNWGGTEYYAEYDFNNDFSLGLFDGIDNLSSDYIITEFRHYPSHPDRTLWLTDLTDNGTDDTFVDVEFPLGLGGN